MNYRRQHLAGITIIEVLFSVGIIVTGLLGVAGLIMIAGAQMTQGLEADAMSNAGLNAVAEFDTRKMRRPDSLLWYNPSTSSFTSIFSNNLYGPGLDGRWGRARNLPSFDGDDDNNNVPDDISEAGWPCDYLQGPDGVWGFPANSNATPPFNGDDDNNGVINDISEAGSPGSDDIYSPVDDIPSPSFCIDPFFIAQQIADNNLTDPAVSFFPGIPIPPGNPNEIVQMLRITLRNNNRGVALPMKLLQSREIFLAKDDLSISKPPSATELPQQTWITNQAGNYVKRLNAAETSWMATLTPSRNRENPQNNTKLEPTDQYLLSIVVFNRRYVNYKEDTTNVQKERRFDVKFLNGGYGGGEVELLHTDPTKLDLKHGDWIMLAANSTIGPVFRWYRITYIEDETRPPDDTNPEYYRFATLKGPDWTRPEWHGTGTGKSHATFIPGVVGVFEKTIRFESTSLFNSP